MTGRSMCDGYACLTQSGSMTLPTAFSRFNRERYVFELGAGPFFYGDRVNVCIPLWPAHAQA